MITKEEIRIKAILGIGHCKCIQIVTATIFLLNRHDLTFNTSKMKHIKILGSGCPKCKRTTSLVEEAVKETGVDASVEKVEDIMEIMKYNVLSTPVVVINEEVTIKGRVPSKSEMIALLTS